MKTKPTRMGRPEKGSGPVYDLRKKLGLQQQEMADAIGVGIATIRRCEANGTQPTGKAAQKLLEGLQAKTARKRGKKAL